MTQTYKDPQSYLDSAVSKRGKSGSFGVYLSNVTVVAEANTDYGYKAFTPAGDILCPMFPVEEGKWFELLVTLRSQRVQKQCTLLNGSQVYQFLPEGGYMGLNIFLPEVFTRSFQHEVLVAQNTLSEVSNFVGKLPSTIRFNIGVAWKDWEDMVESGEAEEVEYSY